MEPFFSAGGIKINSNDFDFHNSTLILMMIPNQKRKKNLIFNKKISSQKFQNMYLNKWTKNISCFIKKNAACEGG